VVNGEAIMDGHHRAIAQWLELGEVPYVVHENDPSFQKGKPLSWDDIKATPTWGKEGLDADAPEAPEQRQVREVAKVVDDAESPAAPEKAARAFDDLSDDVKKQEFAGPRPKRELPDQTEVSRVVAKARAGGEPLTPEESDLLMAQVAYGARVAMWQMHLKWNGDPMKNIYAPEHAVGWCGRARRARRITRRRWCPTRRCTRCRRRPPFGEAAPAHGFVVVELPGGGRYLVDPTVAQFYNPNQTGENLPGAVGMRTPGDGRDTMDTLKHEGYLRLDDETARIYGATHRRQGRRDRRGHDPRPRWQGEVDAPRLPAARDREVPARRPLGHLTWHALPRS
jgi:hypothetical protein